MFYNEDGNPDYKYFYQNPQHVCTAFSFCLLRVRYSVQFEGLVFCGIASSRCRTYETPPPRSQIVNTMKRVIKAYEVGSFTENAGAETDGPEDNATTMKTPTPPVNGDKAGNQMAAEARNVEL
jgi:hypothetical protein